jgi:hypothetical protein
MLARNPTPRYAICDIAKGFAQVVELFLFLDSQGAEGHLPLAVATCHAHFTRMRLHQKPGSFPVLMSVSPCLPLKGYEDAVASSLIRNFAPIAHGLRTFAQRSLLDSPTPP